MSAAAIESVSRLLRQTQLGDALMNVPIAAVVIDPGTRSYLAVNDFMCRLSGYSAEELAGLSTDALSAGPTDELMWARLLNAGLGSGEGELRRKDGDHVSVQFVASTTRVGNLEFVLGFFWERGRDTA